MKLLVLGGSKAQLQAIKQAKKLGHQVVVCDYLQHSIGHKIADMSYLVSTFDASMVLDVAMKDYVDGIMTMGTDQPVYTGAYVCHKLGLPTLISEETALCVTNKIHMKNKLKLNNIPTVDYRILGRTGLENTDAAKIEEELGLRYPLVMKPVDSQGQRGIFQLESIDEVLQHIDTTLSFSRSNKVLLAISSDIDTIFFPYSCIYLDGHS